MNRLGATEKVSASQDVGVICTDRVNMRTLQRLPVSLALLATLTDTRAGAQSSDVIRGRVIDRERRPLAGAEVSVSSETSEPLQSVLTDTNGRFTLAIRDRREVYVVSFRRVGFVAFSQTLLRRAKDGTLDVGDVALSPRLDLLEPVNTRAISQLVPSKGEKPAVGESKLNAASAGVFLSDPSDLNALLELLPGVRKSGSGLSVLGADAAQNRLLVDGVDFSGGNIPRDAIQEVKLTTSAYDPSKGRFAGGETSVTTRRGSSFFQGLLRAQLLPDFLAWPDGSGTGVRPTTAGISGFITGPVRSPNVTAFAAVDGQRRSVSLLSLTALDAPSLASLGLSKDARSALLTAAIASGQPAQALEAESRSSAWQGSATARLDWRKSATSELSGTWLSTWSSASRGPVGRLSLPSTSIGAQAHTHRLLLSGSSYFGRVLEELRVSVGATRLQSVPFVSLPGASVRQETMFDDERRGFTMLRFGGAGAGTSTLSSQQVNLVHESSLVIGDAGRHQLKLSQEVIWQERREERGTDRLGRYEFLSIADLSANRPASFQRVLSDPAVGVGSVSLNGSLGDTWLALPGRLQLQGGVRLDITHIPRTPERNAVLDSAFGLRTDRIPPDVGVSPRVGFVVRVTGTADQPLAPTGTVARGFEGARAILTPADAGGVTVPADPDGITLSGGVGAFRGVVPLGQIGGLFSETGLPSAAQQIRCVGDATPISVWTGNETAIPQTCRNGVPAAFASALTPANVLAKDYQAPVSWRANLSIDGIHRWGWGLAPQVTFVRGRHVESTLDRNLSSTPGFILSAEGNRPVFALRSEVDASSGLFAPGAARPLVGAASVTERRTDMVYDAANVMLGIARQRPTRRGARYYGVAAWTPQRIQQRGFLSTTSGDPRQASWFSSANGTKEIIVGATDVALSWFRLAARVRVASGMAYTPLVSQDINGDGLSNDRAFIFDPLRTRDTSLARGLTQLLTDSDSRVRSCLNRQRQQIAEPNSCRTDWTAQVDLAVHANPSVGFGAGRRWRLSATLVNANSALVRLFRLQNSVFGRSALTSPDPRLLQVIGFDQAQNAFRYRVNQQFGRSMDNGAFARWPPFEVHVGVQVPLDRSRNIIRASVPRERAVDDSARIASVRQELVRRFFNAPPVDTVLAYRDTLGLTADQVRSIRATTAQFAQHQIEILAPLVEYALSQPTESDGEAFNARLLTTDAQLSPARDQARQRILSFLTIEQRVLFATLVR